MVRSVALCRFSRPSGLVQRTVSFPSSWIQSCPVLTEFFLENVSHFSSVSSDFVQPGCPSVPVSTEKSSLGMAAAARRDYEKQTSLLRKKYAAEMSERQKREQKDEEMVRARIAELKAQRLQLKKEKSTDRAIEVEQENKIMQEHLKEQRAINVTARNKLDARQGLIRHKRNMAIRRQSSMWIEEKDLERRILESMSNPFHLRGSVNLETLDRDDSYYEADEAGGFIETRRGSTMEFKLDTHPGHTLHLLLFPGVQNSKELLNLLQRGALLPELASLNTSMVPDTFPLLAAAHKSLLSHSRGSLTTRTIHSELIFNY